MKDLGAESSEQAYYSDGSQLHNVDKITREIVNVSWVPCGLETNYLRQFRLLTLSIETQFSLPPALLGGITSAAIA